MATLSFKGKSFIQNYHLAVKYHELIPVKKNSLTNKVSLNDNLIIHGDNLKALKALLPTYAGKIKCIYIDPPYNTGNEDWVYNDNVNSPMIQEWLSKVVDKEDLTRHDKWLCMMMPRLKLLRELLSPEGSIFCSIDDYEVHSLRSLLDEVFGEDNFIGQLVWRKRPNPPNDSKFIGRIHEYVLCYRRSDALNNFFKLDRLDFSAYSNPDDDIKGDWKPTPLILTDTQARPNLVYEVISPSGKTFKCESGWRIEEALFNELNKNEQIYWGINGSSTPVRKRYLSEDQGILLNSIVLEYGSTITARKEIKEIFGKLVFDTPKPTKLIKALIRLSTDNNSLVLDSFAGSGTTAHAVLDLNKEENGNRRFVLVECLDYADNITAERVRRVIKGVPDAKDEKLRSGLGGSFSFFELGEPIELESILKGSKLPNYMDLARYVFYTATSEEFLPEQVDEDKHFIGESKEYEVYLFYKPDLDYLKSTALTLEVAKALGDYTGKKKLVFAPTKYLDLNDSELLAKHGLKGIEYCQLPFEIYKLRE